MIRKITDPLRDGTADEVEEEQEVNKGAPKDAVKDNRLIRYGPAFEAVPAVRAHSRAFPRPLHKRRRYDVGDIFDSECFPFCRVQWRNGRQMVEWSQPELREADVTAPRSTTPTPTTSSTDASTTASSTEATTSTDASMTQMPPTTTSASTTTASTTTTSPGTLLEQLAQIVLASPENTTSAVTQLIQQLQQQVAPTTEATSTTEKPNNNGTVLEQLVEIVLTSPENTASAVTQLIQQLQQTFAPTTPTPTTTTETTATTDKPNNVGSIIESIASLGLDIENVRII